MQKHTYCLLQYALAQMAFERLVYLLVAYSFVVFVRRCCKHGPGKRTLSTATQQLPAHRKTSYQNPQKGSVQLGIFSTKFGESTQTAQAMPNNRKSSTTSTTSTTTAASKKIPRPGNNTVYSIQVLTITAITKSKAKSKVANETPPRCPRGYWAVESWGFLFPLK